MTQLAELRPASYRGARFLIGDVSTDGGRKQVVHEFPNSNRREIDDLGLLNKTYSITGLVTTSAARDSLIRALDGDGLGELIHPVFGTLNVSSQPYTVTETTRELGVIRFQMSFIQTEPQLFPVSSPAKQAEISSQASSVISAINDEIAERFEVEGIANFDSAQSKLLAVADAVLGQSFSTAVDQGVVSIFSKAVAVYTGGINQNIFDPQTLALTFTGMFNEFGLLSSDAQTMLNLTIGLIDFGDNDEPTPTTTAVRIQRENNRQLVNSATRFNAMAQSYDNAVNIDFISAVDLEATEQQLEEAYQAVINDNNLTDATNELLIDLRTSVQSFLDEATTAAFKVALITDVNEQPASILTYSYYGSTDNTEDIVTLNGIVNTSFVEGNVNILTP